MSSKKNDTRNVILAEIVGFLLMTGTGVCSTYWSETEGSLATFAESSSTVTNNGMLPGSLLVCGTGAVATSSGTLDDSSSEQLGPFWRDSSGGWHFGNDVPYSYVEERAGKVYDALHGRKDVDEKYPIIVAESTEVYEAADRLLGGRTPDSMKRALEILEKALTNETDNMPPQ